MTETANTTNDQLNRKQRALLDEIFTGDMDEDEVLAKHRIKRSDYRFWLGQENFRNEFFSRLESARRQSRLIITRYAPVAAARLVSLMNSDKEETARRACLDIIAASQNSGQADADIGKVQTAQKSDTGTDNDEELTDQQVRAVLDALAQQSRDGN